MSLFVKIGTQALTDPKFVMAGPEASWVWLRGLLFAKDHLTDGFVPSGILPLITLGCSDPAAVIKRLVEVDLWTECEGGYTVGQDRWARHQTTKEEVEDKREADRVRQAAWRDRQRAKQNGTSAEDASGVDGQDISTSDNDEGATAASAEPDGLPFETPASPTPATAESDPLAKMPATAEKSVQPDKGVTDVSQKCHVVTDRPEYRAQSQSTEPVKEQHTHRASGAAAVSPPPGSMAEVTGMARRIVHAYPLNRAAHLDPLELPPDQVAHVEAAILHESGKAGCDVTIAAGQLLARTEAFAARVAEWPPGERGYIPGLRKFFREHMYRDLGRFERGEDRGRKGHGSAAGPSARQQRHDGNRAKLAGAFRHSGGGGRDGGAVDPDDGELREPGAGGRPGRVVEGTVERHRRAA